VHYYLKLTYDSGIPDDYIVTTNPYTFSKDIEDAKMFSESMPFAMAIMSMCNKEFGEGVSLIQKVLCMPCIDAMIML